jgi:trafficking kinesin-binding protein 2
MINNFKRGFNEDYRVKLTPNKLKILYEVDWSAFGVGWPPEGSLDKTVVNEVYRVIEKKKNPNTQENGKSQEAKTGLQKPNSVVYLNSGSNLLGRLRRNQCLSVLMGSFGAPVCTSSPKMNILKED